MKIVGRPVAKDIIKSLARRRYHLRVLCLEIQFQVGLANAMVIRVINTFARLPFLRLSHLHHRPPPLSPSFQPPPRPPPAPSPTLHSPPPRSACCACPAAPLLTG